MMTIHLHKGVDSIAFGMTRAKVAGVVGQVSRRARRNQYDASEYDFFPKLGMFVYYDAGGACQAVEFTRDAKVLCGGYELFAHPAHEARAWARAQDHNLDDKDGFVSTALGLSMYAPFVDEPDLDDAERAEPAQSFLAFRAGYYEEERERQKAARNQK